MNSELLYVCEICQTVLDQRHGEAVCPNCGRTLDCTDLSVLPAHALVDEEDGIVLRPGADLSDFVPKAPARDQQPERAPPPP